MPIVKIFSKDYEFKVDATSESSINYRVVYYFFLKSNYYTVETYDKNERVVDNNSSPIIVNENGICTWDLNQRCFLPMKELFQVAYTAYTAEKELLG